MWEFRFQERPMEAKILDVEWLRKFQQRTADVRPGDALRARVKSKVSYGYDGEVVSVKHSITHVIEVIPYNPPIQTALT